MPSPRAQLESVVGLIPLRSGSNFTIQRPDPAFIGQAAEVVGYVWPEIRMDTPTPKSSIFLLTAQGAMGKSCAARAIAAKLRAPLVDVAKLKVGSDTLTGLLSNVLGFHQVANYVDELKRGSASLVLDGLDEAQLRVGSENFEAFISDVGQLTESAEAKRQIIMLGRGDAMDSAHVVLLGMDIEPVRAEIVPLNYQMSCRLIDCYLDNTPIDGVPYTVHRTSPGPFGDHRDRALGALASALGTMGDRPESYWDQVDYFLGYPPVLMALARHLAVGNPRQSGDLFTVGRSTRGDLLRKIVESILARESQKVAELLAPALEMSESQVADAHVYGLEEQALRLVQHLSGTSLRIASPGKLNDAQRLTYERRVSEFITDHPFLRDDKIGNVVFSDYIRAIVTVSPLQMVHGVSQTEVSKACPSLGPFYGHFVLSLTSSQDDPSLERAGHVNESLVGDLIRSFVIGATGRSHFFYTNFDGASSLQLFEELVDESDAGRPDSTGRLRSLEVLEFEVQEPGALTLESPIHSGTIFTTGGVIFTEGDAGEIRIGPILAVNAGELQFVGRTLVSISGKPKSSRPVTLRAKETANHDSALRVTTYGEDALEIDWPAPGYQWLSYQSPSAREPGQGIPSGLRWQLLYAIRRVLLAFRMVVSELPSAFSEYIERDVIGGNDVVGTVFECLLTQKVVQRDGNVYHLNLNQLGEYGVSWSGLRSSEFEIALAQLHQVISDMDAVHKLVERLEQ